MSSKSQLRQRGGSHEVTPSSGKGSRYPRALPSLLQQAAAYRCQCLCRDAHTRSPRGRQRGAQPLLVWPGISLGLVLSATRARSPRGPSRRSADNARHESPFSAPRAVGSRPLSAALRKEKQKPAKSLSFPLLPVL